MTARRVAVIGGGAAGVMAALFAAHRGDTVTVLEKNAGIGRKILITGKGRCNLTNHCDVKTVIDNTPTNGRFLYSALHRFGPADTMAFFEEAGLLLKTERGGRVFPVSDKALDVVRVLEKLLRKADCRLLKKNVTELIIKDNVIAGVRITDEELFFDKVIVACGGCSYPQTGSTGDGYRFARQAGHTVTALRPSLIPLVTQEKPDAAADALLLKNVALTVTDRTKKREIYHDFGELQLMRYGVTGAMILSASAHMKNMESGRYVLSIDLKPALSPEKLDARLQRELSAHSREPLTAALRTLLPSGMIGFFSRTACLPAVKRCGEITKEERRRAVQALKDFCLTVQDYRPIEEAVITSGGVSVREINPATMESRLVKGLFFAGEVIDIDAYTGGFNLQAAFSTGVLAGEG